MIYDNATPSENVPSYEETIHRKLRSSTWYAKDERTSRPGIFKHGLINLDKMAEAASRIRAVKAGSFLKAASFDQVYSRVPQRCWKEACRVMLAPEYGPSCFAGRRQLGGCC